MESNVRVIPELGTVSRVSWGSIFAGTVVGLITQFILIMIGLAIGFGTINPVSEQNPLGGLGMGSAIWWTVSSILSAFVGGWVASRLAGIQRIFDGALHGIVTWGVVTLLTLYLLTTTLGSLMGGAFGLVRNAFALSGQAVSAVLPQDSIMQEIQQILSQRGAEGIAQDPNAVNDLSAAVRNMVQGGMSEADRENVITLLMRNTNMTRPEAEDMVQRINTTVQQAGPQARQTAGNIADALSSAALWSTIMLILSGAAAGLGGYVGRVKGPVKVSTQRERHAA